LYMSNELIRVTFESKEVPSLSELWVQNDEIPF
jgi:hypothetical protein